MDPRFAVPCPSKNHAREGWPTASPIGRASSWGFGVALATIVVWGVTGPIFGFSDTWQLVINTGTTMTEREIRLMHGHYQRLVMMAKRDLSLTVSHSVEEADERHRAKTRHSGPGWTKVH